MNELIKVTEKKGKQLVSARELHEFLESKERFSRWFERMLEFGFENEIDFTPYQNVHPQNKQPLTDYAIVLDMAKELSMLSRSEKGKQARRYFIEMEKKAMQPLSQIDMIIQSAQALKEIQTQQQLLEIRIADIEQRPQINAPIHHFSILGFCNNNGLQISMAEAAAYGRKCSKMCREIGAATGSVPDPRYGKVKTYPQSVLDAVILNS
jgi:phage anti-repressor protein